MYQALQRLELEGLVEIMPRKGVVVLPDSISEIIKISESRAAVEAGSPRPRPTACPSMTARSCWRSPTPPGTPGMARASTTSSPRDRAFPPQAGGTRGNSVLSDFAQQLHERSIRYWYLHLWQTMDVQATTRQHAAIADAIAKHDGERAAAMREHIDSLKGRLMQIQDATRRHRPPPIR